MIYKILILIYIFLPFSVNSENDYNRIDQEKVAEVMRKTFLWQMKNLPDSVKRGNGTYEAVDNLSWIRAAFFTGVINAFQSTNDSIYLKAALQYGEESNYQPGLRSRHADDHCMGQVYLNLYEIYRQPQMISPFVVLFDSIISNPTYGPTVGWSKNKNWSWCDALFMAPPVWAKLAILTGDKKYLDEMDKMWWQTFDYLYDSVENLYYRDEKFIVKPGVEVPLTASGKKVMWARGNGWVIGGLVSLLKSMPADYPSRPKYEQLFKKMMAKIVRLQGKDGLWRSSLLEFNEFPSPETSASGFFCYGLTWGVNNGLLNEKKYKDAAKKAWKGMEKSVDRSGKLGWVQKVGHAPQSVSKDDTMEYGVGALLLAGSEMIIMLKK